MQYTTDGNGRFWMSATGNEWAEVTDPRIVACLANSFQASIAERLPLQKYKLQRATGPLTFEGQLLSEATTPESQAGHERRAFRLALYRAKSGRLVAEFAYTSGWKTETPVFDAEAFDADVTAETLTDWFEEAAGIDPESGNIGCIKGVVPGTDHWKERNERIQALLRDEFDRCLSVVLDLPMFEESV